VSAKRGNRARAEWKRRGRSPDFRANTGERVKGERGWEKKGISTVIERIERQSDKETVWDERIELPKLTGGVVPLQGYVSGKGNVIYTLKETLQLICGY